MDRKQIIIDEIKKSEKPLSASALAKKLHVSRQIIVGDVALIRAAGTQIIATPRGYVLEEKKKALKKNWRYRIPANRFRMSCIRSSTREQA